MIILMILLSSTILAKKENVCDEVIPKLYIGGTKSLKYVLKNRLVDRVVSFGELRGCYHKTNMSIKILKFDMKDSLCTNILYKFDRTYRFIERSHKGVLIHCAKGHSRSASIVIAYLMKKYSIGYSHSYAYLKKIRPTICPNKSFVIQLKNYGYSLCKKRKIDRRKLPKS